MDEKFKNRGRPQLLPCEQDLELRLGLPRGEDKPRDISTGKGPNEQQQVGFLQLHSMEVKDEAHFASTSAYGSFTRTTTVLVVGWPPLSSFRKNLASSSRRPPIESENEDVAAHSKKNLLVKINMDGVPIGRKVDLYVHDNYEKLSLAVEELFVGLLAGNAHSEAAKQMFTGLLDGTGEYTLVYEDNAGDRMLVGDAPWNIFTSVIKRLRVTKTSDISALKFKSTWRLT